MLLRLAVLAAVCAVALAQERCESPPQWTSTNFYFSPSQGHLEGVEALYSYDKTNERKSWREKIQESSNSTYDYVHRIELYRENKEYTIDVRTGECRSYVTRFAFYAHDVPVNARFRGNAYLGSSAVGGGSVEISEWDARLSSTYWDGSFTVADCIPYHSNHFNSSTFGLRFESIVNVSPGFDPNEFIPPSSCTHYSRH